jgi:RNA polymerase sigma-70 factor (ECF subfamily)
MMGALSRDGAASRELTVLHASVITASKPMNDVPAPDSESRRLPSLNSSRRIGAWCWRRAKVHPPAAQAALETLCRTYWQPLYAFARRQGHSPSDAEDLIQSFFERFIGRHGFRSASREKGRLRSLLLVSLKRFLVNEWHRARADKRGGKRAFIPLDTVAAEAQYEIEATQELSAEKLFDRRWASALLDNGFHEAG